MFHLAGGVSPALGANFPIMKNLSTKFNSITAFSAWLKNTAPKGYFKDKEFLSSEYGTENFTGTANFIDADNLLKYGWNDGARRVSAVMASGGVGSAPVRRVVNSVVGFAPNVPTAIAGRPKNMRRAVKREEPRRVVSIVYNCCVAADVDAPDMERAAAKLFNVVTGLERAGVRVELWVAMINIIKDQNASAAVKIKSADQPFNMLKMVYPCIHPSFFRRHLFAFIERAGVTGKSWGCYGYVIKNKTEIKHTVSGMGINTENIFSFDDLHKASEDEILKMIK